MQILPTFRPKSVDKIMGVFTRAISDLDVFISKTELDMEIATAQIHELNEKHEELGFEAERARSIKAKLSTMVDADPTNDVL